MKSYKQMFTASQDRAHYKNVATKIDREMRGIRSQAETSQTAPRRWVWELLQNAKDVRYGDGIHILIECDSRTVPGNVVFKHTGKPFTTDNIRFLIEQISTKDRAKDENGTRIETGRFGTGFLSTHLLSEKVTIQAVVKESNLEPRYFQLELDRSGTDLEQITNAVVKAKLVIENLDQSPPYSDFSEGAFNTSFIYPLRDQLSLSIANKGINDLYHCLPFTLIFVPEIQSVQLSSYNVQFQKDKNLTGLSNEVLMHKIHCNEGGNLKSHLIATITKGHTSIALPVEIHGSKVHIKPIPKDVPKIFCDFPLVGTEIFPFPVIVNDPHFNPTDPRDGIFLTGEQRVSSIVEENRLILKNAISLYFHLLEFASSNQWENLHLLSDIRPLKDSHEWITKEWYSTNILDPIREKLLYTKIVKTLDNTNKLYSILNPDKSNYIWFPTAPKEQQRSKIWELACNWFPYSIPQKNEVEWWHSIVWDNCGKLTANTFSQFVENQGSIEELSKKLPNINCFDWLNQFYKMLELDEKSYDSIINSRAIFPNQNGIFCKKESLFNDKGDIEEILKDIMFLLGHDTRGQLADSNINISIEHNYELSNVINQILSDTHKANSDRDNIEQYKDAFKLILSWFQSDPIRAESLFPHLFKNKHLLYDDETIMENMNKAEQLDSLLLNSGVSSVSELKKILEKGQLPPQSPSLSVTQEILASMGISSLAEWEEAIKNKDLAELFAHQSNPSHDMFTYAHNLIRQANHNILLHLDLLGEYDVSSAELLAPTTWGGITKNGADIKIVCRPANSKQVIIYYGSERDVLDYEHSELWVDDGINPKKITLGHILKSANIRKFPI